MTLESALLCAFRHFSSLSVTFGTLKVIEAFPDAICLSNGRMESRSISRSIVICETASGAVECLGVSFTHIDGNVSLRFAGGWDLVGGDAGERDRDTC